jgi:hypothetical protein
VKSDGSLKFGNGLVAQGGGITVQQGVLVTGNSLIPSGTLTLPSGAISVTSTTAGVGVVDVHVTGSPFTGDVILGTIPGAATATLAKFSEGLNTLLRVESNGFVEMARVGVSLGSGIEAANGVTVSTGGLHVTSGGVSVETGHFPITGDVVTTAGAMSIVTSSTTASVIDISSTSGASANLLNGYIPNAGTGNLLLLTEGVNQLMQVQNNGYLTISNGLRTGTGSFVVSGGASVTGDLRLVSGSLTESGAVSVSTSATGAPIVDVVTSSTTAPAFTATVGAASALICKEGSNVLFQVSSLTASLSLVCLLVLKRKCMMNALLQVHASGLAAVGSKGLNVPSGQLRTAAGVAVKAGGVVVNSGDLTVTSGALSISTGTVSSLDVTTTATATFTGNLITAAVGTGSTDENAIMLLEGSNRRFSVSFFLVWDCTMPAVRCL